MKNIVGFNNKSRPRAIKDEEKKDTCESAYGHYEGRELTFNALKSGIFPIKTTKGKGRKILTPKQMLQRLPVTFAQVANTSIY